ncbi:SHOCT domain-containing protein [Aliivibrio sp. S3MY1]|uniref:SHOCT domain-containing protein n=2 Tax=Aliivibrio TaxID=511678 RepID=UPI0023799053|nr:MULTISPECIES: SHOCT domain-containing protein [unclassified Aliivibrio]MDD9197421.1 SHOCT domain-containing protein [Aliivibrio sp. S3MY1]MDD9200753.1 SHOCT domain-containing protein [Aliivibrio sp. S2MY1]
MKRLVLVFCLVLAGCANPGVVEISPDTYVIFRDDHGGIFGNAGALRAEVIHDANEFAKSKGKVAIPVSSNYTPLGNGPGEWASFEYQFRVVNKSDEEVVRTSLRKQADYVVDKNIKVESTITNGSNSDIYNELIKAHQLFESGVLTEAEYKQMKAKILSKS